MARSRIHWGSFVLGAAATVLIAIFVATAGSIWGDSVAWRVHNVPMLSTTSERAFVSTIDALQSFGDGIRKVQRGFLSN
ncbi:hypothetical protein A8H39_02015 [Paraburkholderia fungorum]|uniref:hypothetical protein n=1 Tax=Paraburkholderia fungorum TaxID=134537 RepID=UPI000480EA9C|nr:hypothetical protein [Paraburkholderia fungorum]MBB5546575.1 hypothetical protein [Paraburkholderia fungorum]PNE59947.1 hypothetical protein A8H39_02015 [Paraburkholderia fungorum]